MTSITAWSIALTNWLLVLVIVLPPVGIGVFAAASICIYITVQHACDLGQFAYSGCVSGTSALDPSGGRVYLLRLRFHAAWLPCDPARG